MESVGRRGSSTINYRELAGMSQNKETKEKAASKVGSRKSGGSRRTKKSDKDAQLDEIDQRLEVLQDKLDSNPAYVAEQYEQVDKKFGSVYLTEEEIKESMTDQEVMDLSTQQKLEIATFNNRLEKLKERQVLLDQQQELMKLRRNIELTMLRQKVQQKESMMQGCDEILMLEKRDAELEDKRKKMAQQWPGMDKKDLPDEEIGSVDKARQWLQKEHGLAGSIDGSRKTRADAKSVKSGKVVDEVRSTTSQARIKELQKQLEEANRTIRHEMKEHSVTSSQKKIMELENELKGAKEKIVEARANKGLAHRQGMQHLQRMGLVPREIPNEQERTIIQQEGIIRDHDIGKLKRQGECMGCGEKPKLKSGKFVKTNIDIKIQEQWPHVNVMRKYAKKCAFDNMDFEMFIAGESRVVANMQDGPDKQGRLQLMSSVAHWLCTCKNWPVVRGLYEGIIESVELGEATWCDDFSHYENMLAVTLGTTNEIRREEERPRQKESRKMESYWCKAYQKNLCTEKSPHMAQLRMDEPPVPVIHVCAHCMARDNRRESHPEMECPSKKL